MAAAKVSFHIDGTRIEAAEAVFAMNAQRTDLGIPKMELPVVSLRVKVNLNDEKACSFQTIKKLFDLTTATNKKDRIKAIKVEYWKDLSMQDPVCTYSFQGWISSFRTSNVGGEDGNGNYNHYLDIEVFPDSTEGRYQEIKIGN